MQIEKPFSQACENNKRAILSVLERKFANCRQVLEIGSGTGQHAVFWLSICLILYGTQAINHTITKVLPRG